MVRYQFICAIDDRMHLRIYFRGSRLFQAKIVPGLCVLLTSSFNIRVSTLVHVLQHLLVNVDPALRGDTQRFAYHCGSLCDIFTVVLLENVDSADCAWLLRRM